MPTQSKTVAECIQDLIVRLDAKTVVFSELMKEYDAPISEEEQFQFNVSDAAPCFQDVAFVKDYNQDQLNSLSIQLGDGYVTNLGELQTAFGEFDMAPPTPGGTWSALVDYETQNKNVSYTIIAEAAEPITLETQIRSISIRLDHQE